MSANGHPIFPATPYAITASLAAVTACTTRAPTATASLAAANISILCPTSTSGRRIDKITVQAASSAIAAPTAAQVVGIWMWDGTTAYLIDEIAVTLVTPSTTAVSFTSSKTYTTLVLPAAFALYMSTTVTTTAATTALSVSVFGGDY
tara:strand:- start:497 stop:940 length:444 start_codon:yes stop_codon:yes gene_type:complete